MTVAPEGDQVDKLWRPLWPPGFYRYPFYFG